MAELSKKAHEIALKEEEEKLSEVEEEIEMEVARLFGLSEEEVGDVNEALRVVYGKGRKTEDKVEKKATEHNSNE